MRGLFWRVMYGKHWRDRRLPFLAPDEPGYGVNLTLGDVADALK